MRNSWGAGWGSSGYVLVKRGIDLCLIESYARTTNIDTTTTTSLENFCTNRPNGNYANPNECQSYISCSNGSAYKMVRLVLALTNYCYLTFNVILIL